jgi:demethylmenaquinone methyltransferase/2-methoxy-6-polyprenyl-1,4-benzoquinol methylase
MSLEQRDLFIKHIFTTVAPYVDFLSSSFSFGVDHFWRRQAVVRSGIVAGERVLDVCSGTGELAFLLSRHVGPQGSVTGTDFCEEMLDRARRKKGGNHANLSFLLSDTKRLPFRDNTFDAVTVSFGMRNIPDTALALQELDRVLKPGGKFVCLELTRPRHPGFRFLYEWYVSKVMPLIAKFVVKTSTPYLYLPRSINSFYPPDEFKDMIHSCGFENIQVGSMTFGIATLYTAVKRG